MERSSKAKTEKPEKNSGIDQKPNNDHSRHKFSNKLKGPKEPENFRKLSTTVPGLPILTCSNNLTVETEWNLINFTEAIENYVELTYGDISQIFRNNKYPEYPRPEPLIEAEKLSPEHEPLSIELLEKAKARIKDIRKLEQDKVKVYALIKNQLSRESLSRVEAHESYALAEQNRVPLQLWIIILATHLINTNETDEDYNKQKAMAEYNRCHMTWFESLADFKRRFILRRVVYETTWSDPGDADNGIDPTIFKVPDGTAA